MPQTLVGYKNLKTSLPNIILVWRTFHVEITGFLLFCGQLSKQMEIGGYCTLATAHMKVHAKYKEPTRPWAQGHSLQK